MTERIKLSSMKTIGFVSFFVFCTPILVYLYFFHQHTISNLPENWGTFGDYLGGTLNPILGFISFMALLYTIKLQRDSINLQNEELKATREELARSAKAQEASEQILKEQSHILKQQQFETTFFSMLTHLNQLSISLLPDFDQLIDKIDGVYGNQSFTSSQSSNNALYSFLKSISFIPISGNVSIHPYKYYTSDVESVFRINSQFPDFDQLNIFLYEILKFIRSLSPNESQDSLKQEKFYSNIVRASINPELLQILAVLIYSKYITSKEDYKEYKELFIRYKFLERIPLKSRRNPHVYYKLTLLCIFFYSELAFGNSQYLRELKDLASKLKDNFEKKQ